MIAIIDYDAGNIKSVSKAVERLGGQITVTGDRAVIDRCDALILPGVGSFGKAMKSLKDKKLDDCIRKNIAKGKPFLGICLGMQLLFDQSYEDGSWKGLGLIGGDVVRFSECPSWNPALKIPHMGWNKLIEHHKDGIGSGIEEGEYVYFVHSYYAIPKDWDDVVYFSEYGVRVPAVVRKGNVLGMQFHPEKSADTGMKLLKNFLDFAEEGGTR